MVGMPVDNDVGSVGYRRVDNGFGAFPVRLRIVQIAAFRICAHGGAKQRRVPLLREIGDGFRIVKRFLSEPVIRPEMADARQRYGAALRIDDTVAFTR